MQKVTGTLSGGAHPGSYNGQDAYNDMFVVEDGSICGRQRSVTTGSALGQGGCAQLYARSADDSDRGGYMEDKVLSLENHPNDSRMGIDPQGKVQTLSGRMGTGGNNTPMAMVAYRKTAHPQNSEQPQNYEVTDKADTLNVFDNTEGRTPTVAVEGNGARPSHHGDGYIESDQSYTLNTTEVHGVASMEENNYRVRRLTPLECERLQGYPDGWTDIGEWTDSKGKVRQTTDSARYKALGNSIGLPPWKWVLKRISAQYERDATMASLFDGIGGFPLIWEQLNGPGTCLWASEIEEFCIAVTEKRINGNSPSAYVKTENDTQPIVYDRAFGGQISNDGTTPTVSARSGTGGNNQPIIAQEE